MAETEDLGFDTAASPLTPENLIGKTFTGFQRGIFGRDSYGEKTIISFGEHRGGFYLVVEERYGFRDGYGLNMASELSEEEVRALFLPDPDAFGWK